MTLKSGKYGSQKNQEVPLKVVLDVLATDENFNETEYLVGNPDVASAVAAGIFPTGRVHFDLHGRNENRMLRRREATIQELRQRKMSKLNRYIKLDMPHTRKGLKYDFITDELRKETGIVDTNIISSRGYDRYAEKLIEDCKDGLVLDCGAGRPPAYYDNVVNYEIVEYDTTDVVGVGERLPFRDNSFDGVISVAVLEHVRDPFACATEITRVLKAGGRLFCGVPFLQPEHGYPHHYYNMAPQGLRALFERGLTIDDQKVYEPCLPVWALRWIVQSWADGLEGATRDNFLSMPLGKLIEPTPDHEMLAQDWVTALSEKKNFELACSTVLFAHKPDGAQKNAGGRLRSRLRDFGRRLPIVSHYARARDK
jgi:SAM-dependent methyltransferase